MVHPVEVDKVHGLGACVMQGLLCWELLLFPFRLVPSLVHFSPLQVCTQGLGCGGRLGMWEDIGDVGTEVEAGGYRGWRAW